MHNRIYCSERIDDLLGDLQLERRATPLQRERVTPSKIKDELLQELRSKLDPDAIQQPYIVQKTGKLAKRLFDIRQKAMPKKRKNLSELHSQYFDCLQQSLIKKEETNLEKMYKNYRSYEQKAAQSQQLRVQRREQSEEQMSRIDMKTPLQDIEQHSLLYLNLQTRIRERTLLRGQRKFYSFWKSSNNTPAVSKRDSQERSCFLSFLENGENRLQRIKPSYRKGYVQIINSIKDRLLK